MWRRSALALLLAGVLAGCASPFGSTIDCETFLRENAGEGVLRIQVTAEPGGPPVAGAIIIVEARGTCWEHNDRLVTDPQGAAVVALPPSGHATLSAHAERFTQERLEGVPLAAANRTADITLPLFHQRLSWQLDGTLTGQGAGRDPITGTGAVWQPTQLEWARDRATLEGYAQRIAWLNATLSWNNTLTAFADLGIGLGRTDAQPDVTGESDADQRAGGAYTETVSLDVQAMARAGWRDASAIYAGPLAQKPHFSVDGIPYTIQLEAFFSAARSSDVPFPSALGIAAIAGAALLGQIARGWAWGKRQR